MSEGKGDSEQVDLEKTVCCPVCLECMLESRTLYPCMHTFCADCISQLQVKRRRNIPGVHCPMCRGFVPNKEIKQNRLVDTLIGRLISSEMSGPQQCVQCDSPDVSHTCLSCIIPLCSKCKDRHGRIPGCEKHRVVLKSEQSASKRGANVFCTKHNGFEIRMNCLQCNTVMCSKCKYESHDCHESETLQKAMDKYRPLIVRALNNVSENSKEKMRLVDDICKKIASLNENYAANQTKLKERHDVMMKEIETEYHKLTKELKEKVTSQVDSLAEKKQAIEKSLSCEESVRSSTEKLLTTCDDAGLLLELQSGLLQNVQKLQDDRADKYKPHFELYSYDPNPCAGSGKEVQWLGRMIGQVSNTQNDEQCAENSRKDRDRGEAVRGVLTHQSAAVSNSELLAHSPVEMNKAWSISVKNMEKELCNAKNDKKMPNQAKKSPATEKQGVPSKHKDHAKYTNKKEINLSSAQKKDILRDIYKREPAFNTAVRDKSQVGDVSSESPEALPKGDVLLNQVLSYLVEKGEEKPVAVCPSSYRVVNQELTNLHQKIILKSWTCDVPDSYNSRLCLLGNWLCVPIIQDCGSIRMYSLENTERKTVELRGIREPISLHPLGSTKMAVASLSGVHVIEVGGKVLERIFNHACEDVSGFGNVLAAVRVVNLYHDHAIRAQVMTWNINDLSKVSHSFIVDMRKNDTLLGCYRTTIVVCDKSMFVTHSQSVQILQYSLQGQLLQQWDTLSRRTAFSLCDADRFGNLLAVDCRNNRIHVRSAKGGWSVVGVKTSGPVDVAFVDSFMFVLHDLGQQLSKYRILA